MPVCSRNLGTPLTEPDLIRIIRDMNAKSCSLDPIKTLVFKSSIENVIPMALKIVNASLTSGTVTSAFEQAIVRPLPKKSGLDPNQLSNYRPVSNLPFMSKVLEKAVLNQLDNHMSKFKLYTEFQSAYRRFHTQKQLF